MSTDNDMLQGFESVANTSASSVNVFVLGTLFSVVYLIAAYILFSAYKDLHDGNRSINQFLWLCTRIILLLLILSYVLLS